MYEERDGMVKRIKKLEAELGKKKKGEGSVKDKQE